MNVIFDSCVVDRLARQGIDPIADLRDTEFVITYTPDLGREYRCAVEKESIADEVRYLHGRIIDAGTPFGFFGWGCGGPCLGWGQGVWAHPSQIHVVKSIPTKERPTNPIPKNRTDAHLVALARDAIVITDNFNERHWRNAPRGTGRVIIWKDFATALINEGNCAAAIRHFLNTA